MKPENKEKLKRAILMMQAKGMKLPKKVVKPKYLNEFHQKSVEKCLQYIEKTKQPLSLEAVLKQQERNSKDNTQEFKK